KFEDLAVYFPVHEAILEMVVNHLPNPRTAQQYRIEKIWEGNMNSEVASAMKSCDPAGPLIICLSKVQADKYGLIATGRIFSGTCSEKQEVFLIRENEIETIQKIALFMGQRRRRVKQLPAGNIVAIEGLKKVKSGETLIDPHILNEMVPFENVKYVTTPVVTVSIEPEYLREFDPLKEIIEHLLIEDPNLKFEINEENGEFLLSGMGPLHLEITAKEIEKRGVKVSISEPRPVFKESCRNKSSLIEIHSPNGQNFIKLQIERLDDKTIKFLQTTNIESIKPLDHLKSVLKMNTGLTDEEIQEFWRCDEDHNILIFKNQKEVNALIKENVLTIVEKIHVNGPLAGEKLTQIKIKIMDLVLNDIDEERMFTGLSALLYDGIKQGLKESEMILLEPIYKTIIQLPPEYIKNTLAILSKYGAKIKAINQEKEYQATIETMLPVRKSIKFVEDIRSSTSGRAFWQNEFHSFMEVPFHEAQEIISDLRFKKGLSW
ncbi:MAG: EF-Tu/IF-2/RF-3 family GTPase, partial [Promethearchaeota archaeon]